MFYVYQFPIAYTIDGALGKIVLSITGIDVSIVGLLLRLLIPLVILKVINTRTLIFNKRLVRLLLLSLVGILLSKWLTTIIYPSLSNATSPYPMNSSKIILRYFILALSLGSVMGEQQNRSRFIKVILFSGFALVFIKQFNLMGVATSGFGSSIVTSSGRTIGYSFESFGFMDKNYFSLLMGINIIVAVGYYEFVKGRIKRYIILFMIMLSLLNLLLSMSFGGIFSSAIGLIILLYYQGKKIKWFTVFLPVSMLLIFVTISGSGFLEAFEVRLTGVYRSVLPAISGSGFSIDSISHTNESSLTARIGSAIYALNLFVESPIFGYGGEKDLTSSLGSGTHTTYIAWLTNFGIITIIPLFLLLRGVYSEIRKRMKSRYNRSEDNNFQLIMLSLLSMLLINGIGSPIMLYIITFAGVSIYANQSKRSGNGFVQSKVQHNLD